MVLADLVGLCMRSQNWDCFERPWGELDKDEDRWIIRCLARLSLFLCL